MICFQQQMLPEKIAHYRIIKKLGQGGMGEVYLAEDTSLERPVALKILPAEFVSNAERMKRFVQEAKAASLINHPNVAHIYEISQFDGIHYIAMEYIDGQTLTAWIQQRRDLAEILDVAIQITDALDRASSKGIVHRDIKPPNIVIANTGEVKVLDFGIAKVIRENTEDSNIETQTRTGSIFGTTSYMSPEQALGKSLDQRSDLFSFGIVLYEMLTGKNPFAATSIGETIDRILHLQPEPAQMLNSQVPAELDRIVRKCLERDLNMRYQSAKELSIDLKNLKRHSTESQIAIPQKRKRLSLWIPLAVCILAALAVFLYFRNAQSGFEIHSLAVFPFVNESGNSQADYISDGITESIINNLSQLHALRVTARSTVFRYKGQDYDPQQIGRELHADAVITGTLKQQGDTVTVQTDLVSTKDGSQIWGDQFNRKMTNLISLQSEISAAISQKLRLKLTGEEQKRVTKQYTMDSEAYQLYLKGRYEWNKFTAEGGQKSIEYFRKAIDKDPTYALAYSGLSDAYGVIGANAFSRPSDSYRTSQAAAEKALELDPDLAEAHSTIATMLMFYDRNYKEAEIQYREAIKLNPNYSDPHDLLAYCLVAIGNLQEATKEAKIAADLDPLSLVIAADLGWIYYIQKDYPTAQAEIQKAIDLDTNFQTAHNYMISVMLAQKKYSGAIEEAKKAVVAGGNNPMDVAFLGFTYAAAGNKSEALKILKDLNARSQNEYISPHFLGLVLLALGEKAQAFKLMQQACDQRDVVWYMLYLKVDPTFDAVHNDPAFQKLLTCMNLQ